MSPSEAPNPASLPNGAGPHKDNGSAAGPHTNGTNTNGVNGVNGVHVEDINPNGVEEEEEEEAEMFPDDLKLRVMGIGTEYPPFRVGPSDLQTVSQNWYPQTETMKKVLSINRYTGIDTRAAIGECTHPLANQPSPPSIGKLHEVFMEHGVPLATNACRKAISDAGYTPSSITHSVFTTCTDSANPGYDTFVLKNLGVRGTVEKILLHGVGCSGGLAGLRTACNLALGARARGRRARVLVCATEICTVLVRSELDSIAAEDNVRIGICLFSDCSSAVVISNGVGEDWEESRKGVYDILGWKHELVKDTEKDLGFDVDAVGWKVVLTPRVPSLTSAATPPIFNSLLSSIPAKVLSTLSLDPLKASDLDWALHPGGSLILTSIEKAMGVTPSHLRASYDIYTSCGNSSSATVFSVMDRLRSDGETGVGGEGKIFGKGVGVKGGRKGVVGCAFGPGVTVEMVLMRRIEKEDGIEAVTNGVNGVTVGGEELD
ncbi:hypothetical protein ABW19_dt0200879 [Dactylella cylindrospora]|nr:hypothetical protein ABW19_dt0200879 [Dactylella cylindrospora]